MRFYNSPFQPDLPTAAPVSIIPSMSNTSFPEAVRDSDTVPCEPIIGTLISVGAPTDPPPPPLPKKPTEASPTQETTATIPVALGKKEKLLKKEKKKEKKDGKKDKLKLEEYREKGSSEPETDGSEAEIWTNDGATTFSNKKKKKSTFGLRSSHPSIVANDLQFSSPMPPVVKKSSSQFSDFLSVFNKKF